MIMFLKLLRLYGEEKDNPISTCGNLNLQMYTHLKISPKLQLVPWA